MKPIPFPQQNATFAKDQPQYLQLPAHRMQDGRVISCWKATWGERLRFLFVGEFWVSQMTFNTPLQPLRPYLWNPIPYVPPLPGNEAQGDSDVSKTPLRNWTEIKIMTLVLRGLWVLVVVYFLWMVWCFLS